MEQEGIQSPIGQIYPSILGVHSTQLCTPRTFLSQGFVNDMQGVGSHIDKLPHSTGFESVTSAFGGKCAESIML